MIMKCHFLTCVSTLQGGDHSLKLSKKMMPATTEEAQTLMRAAVVTYVKDKMLCGGGAGAGGAGGSSKSGGASKSDGAKNGGAKNGGNKNGGDKNGGWKRARDEGGEIADDPAEKDKKTSKKTDGGGGAAAAAAAAPLASAHLADVRVVVTGKVPGMSRKEAEEAVEAAGVGRCTLNSTDPPPPLLIG
jgi:NAD-dependent DNA ligase